MDLARLSKDEGEKLLTVADNAVGRNGKVVAVAAYGSKVAGYARKDSDYDIIVVATKVSGRVKYSYVKEPVVSSALVVEDSLLEKDAKKAYLGEFVSGRLLNVYQPLLKGEVFKRAEVDCKRRVIVEELLEIESQQGEFAQDLVFPLEYFLFNKLHKRALIYPPALYSYTRTYTCALGKENTAFSLAGFEEAARSLQESGIVRLEGDRVRVLGEGLKSRAFANVLSLFNLTTRTVRQYAVHGYVARVGVKVFKDEALSKAKRMQERVDPPKELEEPKRLIQLQEGFVLAKTEQMVDRLAALSGMVAYKKSERSLGEVYSTARLLTLEGAAGGEARFVFKHFADIRAMKWALVNVWSARSHRFSTSPQSRMHREYAATVALRARGVAVPKILGAVLDDKVLVKEYIEGERLSDIVQAVLTGRSDDTHTVERFGEAMAAVHMAGYSLGDSKATNVIVTKDGHMYFTDLEQASEGGDQAWDLATFAYYQAKLSLKEAGMRKVADAFLAGYRRKNGTENIVKVKGPKYLAPFRPISKPALLKAVKDSIDANSA